jgi:hypothetical protein
MTYSANLAAGLVRAGAEVVGVGLARDGHPVDPKAHAVQWHEVPGKRTGPVAALASPLPYTAFSHGIPAMRREVRQLLSEGPWDVVVIDHLQSGWAAGVVRKVRPQQPMAYLSHNFETAVRARVAEREKLLSPRRAILALDSYKIARLERRLVKESALVTAITDTDAAQFKAIGAQAVETVVPGWRGTSLDRTISAELPRRVAILGHWEWHVKQENLERFLHVADPMFHGAGVEILILGPAPQEWRDRLTPQLRATRFAGWVEDLSVELAQCRMGIVAEPVGGGFKLKSLDYVFSRLPMAALSGSVDGLPLNEATDMIIREDETALAAAVLESIDDLALLNRMQDAAFRACQPLRGWDHQGEQLLKALTAALRR